MMDDDREPPPLDDYESDGNIEDVTVEVAPPIVQDAEEIPPTKPDVEVSAQVDDPAAELQETPTPILQKTADNVKQEAPSVSPVEPENSVADESDLFQCASETTTGMQSISLDAPVEKVTKIPVSVDDDEPASLFSGSDEKDDTYDINIEVSDPHKVGEGMNAYMSYKVRTKTSIPAFKRPEMTVDRRFSDFLGLHEKLLAKHRHDGRIVPPAPEKSIVGMTLVKMSKSEEEAASIDFVEKRRAALERYLNRTARHRTLVNDSDFRDFLEQNELPPSTSTRALSGAGVMRLVKNVEGALSKMTIRMIEEDTWFEEKQQQIDSLEQQLRKLHAAFEGLVHHKKELSVNAASFAKSAATLGNAEEHTALSRALAQLSDTFEKLETVYQDQSNTDYYGVSEKLADYLRLILEIKEVFMVRVKSWQNWQTAEQNLQRKKETEAKMQASGKTDKISQIQADIRDLESRVETSKQEFDDLSTSIKGEVQRFEHERIGDFREIILLFLKTLMKSQEQIIKNWEGFMPEARAIA